MTEQDKELLLKDLCARLPYGVKCTTTSTCWNGIYEIIGYKDKRIYLDCPQYDEGDDEWLIENIKPYLRPMSSMTVEEAEKLEQIAIKTLGDFMFEAEEDGGAIYHFSKWKTISPEMFDYLNSIHIDYRGLIPMSLALPAPEGMYKNE